MGRSAIDISGKIFGRLTVIDRGPNTEYGHVSWNCICECGNKTRVAGQFLRDSTVTSCGCYRDQLRATINIYRGMISNKYPMPEAWINSFDNFLKDVGLKPSKEYILDRADPNIPYSKTNCFWNRCNEIVNIRKSINFKSIEYNGKIQSLADWSRELNLDYNTMAARLNRKMPVVEAFTKPIRVMASTLEFEHKGKLLVLPEFCKQLGIGYAATLNKLKKGMSIEDIVGQAVNKE